MERDEKAKVIIQSESLQGDHSEYILPKLERLGIDETDARKLIKLHRQKTDVHFKPPRSHKILGLIFIAAGVTLIAGTVAYLLLTRGG